nr:hypothetical protein CFP56_44336 [Quercus suber]
MRGCDAADSVFFAWDFSSFILHPLKTQRCVGRSEQLARSTPSSHPVSCLSRSVDSAATRVEALRHVSLQHYGAWSASKCTSSHDHRPFMQCQKDVCRVQRLGSPMARVLSRLKLRRTGVPVDLIGQTRNLVQMKPHPRLSSVLVDDPLRSQGPKFARRRENVAGLPLLHGPRCCMSSPASDHAAGPQRVKVEFHPRVKGPKSRRSLLQDIAMIIEW